VKAVYATRRATAPAGSMSFTWPQSAGLAICRLSHALIWEYNILQRLAVARHAAFDFELDANDTEMISKLDTGASSFFSHRDPAIVKWMSERKLDI
jgi:hypothetical protein